MATCPTCGKGERARYYCRRYDCALGPQMTAMPMHSNRTHPVTPPLSPPDVQTTVSGGSADIVVSRDNKARSYHGDGKDSSEAVKDAVKKLLDDPHTAEYVRKG
jgi:hypothetical protein